MRSANMPLKFLRFISLWLVAFGGLAVSAEQPAAGIASPPPAVGSTPPPATTPTPPVAGSTTPPAVTPTAPVAGSTPPQAATPTPPVAGSTSPAVTSTLSVAAASTPPAQPAPPASHAGQHFAGPSSPGYLLQPGDLLQVTVWKETELTSEVLIRPDGGIAYALAGDMQAAGHTVAELTTMLETRIHKFEPDALVTISIKAPNGNRVYVIGKVNHPGDFPLNRPTDVMQALSLAGGATAFADTNSIRVLRRDGDHEKSIAFRYRDIERGRKLDQNILLQSGDTVVVP
jgi:polysaccharide biosynthesis/export protein